MTENTVVDDIEYAIERASDYCNNSTEWFGEDTDAAFNAIIRPVLDAARKELTALAARVAELESSAVELREIREALEQLHDVVRDCGDAVPFTTDNTVDRAIEVVRALHTSEREAQDNIGDVMLALPGTRFMDLPDGGSPSIAEQVKRMAEALAAAEQRVAELERDAQRYRWLRNPDQNVGEVLDKLVADGVWDYRAGEDLDTAIDAALAAAARAATQQTNGDQSNG